VILVLPVEPPAYLEIILAPQRPTQQMRLVALQLDLLQAPTLTIQTHRLPMQRQQRWLQIRAHPLQIRLIRRIPTTISKQDNSIRGMQCEK
jgi:hypothetical protein